MTPTPIEQTDALFTLAAVAAPGGDGDGPSSAQDAQAPAPAFDALIGLTALDASTVSVEIHLRDPDNIDYDNPAVVVAAFLAHNWKLVVQAAFKSRQANLAIDAATGVGEAPDIVAPSRNIIVDSAGNARAH